MEHYFSVMAGQGRQVLVAWRGKTDNHSFEEDVLQSAPTNVGPGLFASVVHDGNQLHTAVGRAFGEEVLKDLKIVVHCAVDEDSGDCRIWKRQWVQA